MKKSSFTRIIIAFVIGVLVPVFSFTIYQLSQQNRDERLIKSIYEKELSGILFSVNQYCYATVDAWVETFMDSMDVISVNRLDSTLASLTHRHIAITGTFIKTPDDRYIRQYKAGRYDKLGPAYRDSVISQITKTLERFKPSRDRWARRAKTGYQKLNVETIRAGTDKKWTLVFFPLFGIKRRDAPPLIGGIVFDNAVYVQEVVAPKFDELNDGTFHFAVKDLDTQKILFSDEENATGPYEQSAKLWVPENLALLIKVAGTTLADIAKTRNMRNIIFLVAMNVLLVVGAFYILKNIFNEMRLAKLKTDFVANVSHELRTPLALIRMHAETLEMGRVPTEQKKLHYYRTIMNESTRLTQLINNILDFSKIESQKKEYTLAPGVPAQVVASTLEMYNYHLKQKGFTLQTDIENTGAQIRMDPEALTQALINLLDNAVKYSTDDKTIRVAVKERDKDVVVSVQDYGLGIPEAEHEKIFEKFYRVGCSLVHNTKGSGLGLNLVRHIMNIHGGRITVKSKVGEGSTFSLLFPKI